jgi:hypothetical protein
MTNDGTYTTFEIAHPLYSGDSNDISLRRGDTVGFFMSVSILGEGGIVHTSNGSAGSPLYLARIHIH